MGNPFRSMIATVRRLEKLPDRFIRDAGPLAELLAEEGFKAQTDPYGQWWAPTVTGKSFDQRQGLQRALRVSQKTLRWLAILDLDHVAFKYHQRGSRYAWGTIPARMMVPIVSRGLGKWSKEFHYLAGVVWRELIRGTGG
mgnify:FL=1